MIAAFRQEIRPMLRLAAPLAMAELGWMSMGFVDAVMAGRLGAAAIGAGSLGNMLFFPIVICGTGMLLGMDTLVAQAFGASDDAACRRTLVQGLWVAAGVAPVVAVLLALTIPLLRAVGTNPHVMELLGPYIHALLWGIPPLLCFAAFRRYLQAMNIVKPITFAVISANLLNFAGNWLFMYGNWGAPRLGLEGSGYSTSISRVYIALVLLVAVLRHQRIAPTARVLHNKQTLPPPSRSFSRLPFSSLISAPLRLRGKFTFLFASGFSGLGSGTPFSWRPQFPIIRRLLALGFPSAMQILVEGAVFGVVTVMAARFDEVSLAAHSIAVNVISTTFMVPLGISSAAAVRVGQAVGRKSPHAAAVSGWTALLLGAGFMSAAGLALAIVPRWIARLYTPEAAVIAASAALLRIAALFEIFDGLQVVATGALRGLGDTRTPALAHFAGYWIVGMPVAWFLCFTYGWGVTGIWAGLTSALILIGVLLLVAWHREIKVA
jgi:MATE family multidrug resistance protein